MKNILSVLLILMSVSALSNFAKAENEINNINNTNNDSDCLDTWTASASYIGWFIPSVQTQFQNNAIYYWNLTTDIIENIKKGQNANATDGAINESNAKNYLKIQQSLALQEKAVISSKYFALVAPVAFFLPDYQIGKDVVGCIRPKLGFFTKDGKLKSKLSIGQQLDLAYRARLRIDSVIAATKKAGN